jgi:CheY-like chemotaxis protein
MALILVIDDQRSIRNVLATVPEELGRQVELAEDGGKGMIRLRGWLTSI